MVSKSEKEFFSKVLSTKRHFDIKGCKTPEDIKRRYRRAVRLIEKDLADAEDNETQRKLLSALKLLHMMMDNQSPVTKNTARIKREMGVPEKRCGMHYVIIDEAKRHPKGYFANALRYGFDIADMMEENEAFRDFFS